MTKHEGEVTGPRSYHHEDGTWLVPSIQACLKSRSSLMSRSGPHSALWATIRLTKVPLPWPLHRWPLHTLCSSNCFTAMSGDEIKAQHRADGTELGRTAQAFPRPTATRPYLLDPNPSHSAGPGWELWQVSLREESLEDIPRTSVGGVGGQDVPHRLSTAHSARRFSFT